MGGHQVPGLGSGDDGYDEDGYDESQRAEILEATRDGPSDGTILTDLAPDLGEEPLEERGNDEVTLIADDAEDADFECEVDDVEAALDDGDDSEA